MNILNSIFPKKEDKIEELSIENKTELSKMKEDLNIELELDTIKRMLKIIPENMRKEPKDDSVLEYLRALEISFLNLADSYNELVQIARYQHGLLTCKSCDCEVAGHWKEVFNDGEIEGGEINVRGK